MHTTTKATLLLGFLAAVLVAPAVSAAHSVAITSGKPGKGEYTMTVDVEGFNVVPFAGKTGTDAHKKGEGHIHYLINGVPAPGDYATTATSFTFTGLKAGDQVGAELVLSDHTASGTDANGNLDGSRVLTQKAVPEGGMGIPGLSPLVLLVALGAFVAVLRRST